MTANLTTLPTNCPVLRDAFETVNAIAVEAVWLPNQTKTITLAQAQTALRDLRNRVPHQQDLRVSKPPQPPISRLCAAACRMATRHSATPPVPGWRRQPSYWSWPGTRPDPWSILPTHGAVCATRVASLREMPMVKFLATQTCGGGAMVARARCAPCSSLKASTCSLHSATLPKKPWSPGTIAAGKRCARGNPLAPAQIGAWFGWATPKTAQRHGSYDR